MNNIGNRNKLNTNEKQDKASHAYTHCKLIAKVAIILVWIAMMVLIAWFSSQPADESTVQSQAVGTVICKIVIKDFKTFTQALKQYYVEVADKFVRKSAHFIEYAALGILSYTVLNFSLQSFVNKPRNNSRLTKALKHFLIPVVWCFSYSITDEIHQYYVDGRYASPTDVLIDTSGAAFGILILLLIKFVIRKIINHRKSKNS